ncbi:MAG: BON domain-containing protein [Pseudomonadota bacterium]
MMPRVTALLLTLTLLGGCAAAPLMVAGGAATTGILVAKDRRTAGTMIDDEGIELTTQQRIAERPALMENSYINITSYNGVVLLLGEVEQPHYREEVEKLARRHEKVRQVRNAITVGERSDSASRNRDARLTARVKSRLIQAEQVEAQSIKVISHKARVYLMGLVSREEAARAVDVVRQTPGVARIVKVFEYTGRSD